MKEEFTYGELVEVRDFDDQRWEERVYVGTFPNTELQWCMQEDQDKTNYNGYPVPWRQIRKIESKPDSSDIENQTIEERLVELEANLDKAFERINKEIEFLKSLK